MTTKELKKLIKLCRDSGITHYKSADVEFSLSEESPIKQSKASVNKKSLVENASTYDKQAEIFEAGGLSEEDLMFWSSPGAADPGASN